MRRPILLIVAIQVFLALALVVVAWYGVDRSRQIAELRVELDQARAQVAAAEQRAMTAERRADELQARVDALEEALRSAGQDPAVIVAPTGVAPSPVSPNEPGRSVAPSPTAGPAAPAPTVGPPSLAPEPTPTPTPPPPCTVRVPLVGTCLLP